MMLFESRRRARASGGGYGLELDQIGILVDAHLSDGRAQHDLGEVVCEGSSTASHDYGFSEHGGRRERPRGGSAASTGGTGGVDGVGSARIGASAVADSTVGWARATALVAAELGRSVPQQCAMMARPRRCVCCRVVAVV